MKDVKFRFVNRIKKTGEIKFVYTSINELEMEDSWQGSVNYERLGINLFTGLLDKNGKEVYEGDLLLFHDFFGGKFSVYAGEWEERYEDLIGPIVYDSCSFCIDPGGHTVISDYIPLDQILSHIHFEVIGNIYTSPELIK